jgi:hypothetical protein
LERPRGDAPDDIATVGGGADAVEGAANGGQLDWLGVQGLAGCDGYCSTADEGLPPLWSRRARR